MTRTGKDTVELVWDVTREHPTLGGALVLRQEGEMLAELRSAEDITIHLLSAEGDRTEAVRLASVVFAASARSFRLTSEAPIGEGWPTRAERARDGFSYCSFSRLTALSHQHALTPRLQWNAHTLTDARNMRAMFTGQLVCAHLRSVPPFHSQESNASGPNWRTFFEARARPGVRDFLLLGDDPLPEGLELPVGVTRATDLGLGLAVQLALLGYSDGFLGMASGVCTAANFSDVPHVIFKHPLHHAAAMARELGAADRFAFANPRQRLWRREATFAALDEALALIAS